MNRPLHLLLWLGCHTTLALFLVQCASPDQQLMISVPYLSQQIYQRPPSTERMKKEFVQFNDCEGGNNSRQQRQTRLEEPADSQPSAAPRSSQLEKLLHFAHQQSGALYFENLSIYQGNACFIIRGFAVIPEKTLPQ